MAWGKYNFQEMQLGLASSNGWNGETATWDSAPSFDEYLPLSAVVFAPEETTIEFDVSLAFSSDHPNVEYTFVLFSDPKFNSKQKLYSHLSKYPPELTVSTGV
jgi:hypothetical protein